MTTIHELNDRRAVTALMVQTLGMINQPLDYEKRLKFDARYQLALDAHRRAESEYNAALASMSSEDLVNLAVGSSRDVTSQSY